MTTALLLIGSIAYCLSIVIVYYSPIYLLVKKMNPLISLLATLLYIWLTNGYLIKALSVLKNL